MWIADRWQEFELLDAGDGEKLERWGEIRLRRPDPQAIWPRRDDPDAAGRFPAGSPWENVHAVYERSSQGGGRWERNLPMPARWPVSYPGPAGPLRFWIEPLGFKHTGLFPEQAVNWDFCARRIAGARADGRTIRILNLFAYTGGATLACALAGADEVVHVDAARGMILRARENLELSGLGDRRVRWIADDVNKFVERELRRGRRYDGILMDPPAYGRGPSGELWKLEDAVFDLVERCAGLLSDTPLFFILNAYTTGLSPSVLKTLLDLSILPGRGGVSDAAEIGLPATLRPLVLPCGATGRWIPERACAKEPGHRRPEPDGPV